MGSRIVHVVVNHLRLRDPLTDATTLALREGVELVVAGGPWMRMHILPLLAAGTERSVGEVVAAARR